MSYWVSIQAVDRVNGFTVEDLDFSERILYFAPEIHHYKKTFGYPDFPYLIDFFDYIFEEDFSSLDDTDENYNALQSRYASYMHNLVEKFLLYEENNVRSLYICHEVLFLKRNFELGEIIFDFFEDSLTKNKTKHDFYIFPSYEQVLALFSLESMAKFVHTDTLKTLHHFQDKDFVICVG